MVLSASSVGFLGTNLARVFNEWNHQRSSGATAWLSAFREAVYINLCEEDSFHVEILSEVPCNFMFNGRAGGRLEASIGTPSCVRVVQDQPDFKFSPTVFGN